MATPGIVGERHYRLAQDIRRTLAQYAELKDIIAMLGLEQLSQEDRDVVARARRLERFLTQPFFTTQQFSGMSGRTVSLKDSLDGCERILRDEFKDFPESALYMIGPVAEAKRPTASKATPTTAGAPLIEHAPLPMQLRILLPYKIFSESERVTQIVADDALGLASHSCHIGSTVWRRWCRGSSVTRRRREARSTSPSMKAYWSRRVRTSWFASAAPSAAQLLVSYVNCRGGIS